MSNGYANICSSVQDHSQKIMSSIGLKEQMRAVKCTKRKLVLQDSRQSLKTKSI